MDKIAVLGDTESIKGFSAVGLEVFACDDISNAAKIFKKIASDGYSVIYVTEDISQVIKKEIEKHSALLSPSVVCFPGVKGSRGVGIASLRDAVIKAVGSDIVFNKE